MWNELEWITFKARLDEDVPGMYVMGWQADYPDSDYFMRCFNMPQRTMWRNEVYDRLTEEARRITDQGERLERYRQADRILVADAPLVPPTYGWQLLLLKPWVSRYHASATGARFWKDVVIEAHDGGEG